MATKKYIRLWGWNQTMATKNYYLYFTKLLLIVLGMANPVATKNYLYFFGDSAKLHNR